MMMPAKGNCNFFRDQSFSDEFKSQFAVTYLPVLAGSCHTAHELRSKRGQAGKGTGGG